MRDRHLGGPYITIIPMVPHSSAPLVAFHTLWWKKSRELWNACCLARPLMLSHCLSVAVTPEVCPDWKMWLLTATFEWPWSKCNPLQWKYEVNSWQPALCLCCMSLGITVAAYTFNVLVKDTWLLNGGLAPIHQQPKLPSVRDHSICTFFLWLDTKDPSSIPPCPDPVPFGAPHKQLSPRGQ